MRHTSHFADAPDTPRAELGFLVAIPGDDSLTPDERLLMIEAMFVHDASGPVPSVVTAANRSAAASSATPPQRKSQGGLRTALHWGIPAAVIAAMIVGRARPS